MSQALKQSLFTPHKSFIFLLGVFAAESNFSVTKFIFLSMNPLSFIREFLIMTVMQVDKVKLKLSNTDEKYFLEPFLQI